MSIKNYEKGCKILDYYFNTYYNLWIEFEILTKNNFIKNPRGCICNIYIKNYWQKLKNQYDKIYFLEKIIIKFDFIEKFQKNWLDTVFIKFNKETLKNINLF